MQIKTSNWYGALREIASLGSTSKRPGSLAGLAQARRENLAQFFTPDALVAFIWKLIGPAIAEAENHGPVSFLDNSVGSARMFQFCEPGNHKLAGADVHADSMDKVREIAEAAGFECMFEPCGMEMIKPENFSVGLINPPFSIHLESPTLEPYPCTTWGKYGPNTSATSQYYALAQALDACDLVIAVMPLPSAMEMVLEGERILGDEHNRLAACIRLPVGVFREEGTDVRTALLVYNPQGKLVSQVQHLTLDSLDDDIPEMHLHCRPRHGKLKVRGVEDEKPSITLPATGNNRVLVKRSGSILTLNFECGLTQAKVMNELLTSRIECFKVEGHRYPKNVKYTGQGKLDLEVHLLQPNPMGSFYSLLDQIESAGGKPEVDPGVMGYFHRRIKAYARESTPMRHTVWMPSQVKNRFTAAALSTHVIDPTRWLSPVIKTGQLVDFVQVGGAWQYQIGTETHQLSLEEIARKFDIPPVQPDWVTVHEGLNQRFPEQSLWWRRRVEKLGIQKWLSWDFQIDDLIEFMLCPKGAICAWEMGLGKTRLAYAMILLSGVKHGLIATEAYLVPEIVRILEEQLSEFIPRSMWQVIETPEQAQNLRTINIISVTRLRAKVDLKQGKKTYAHMLRNRIGLMITDEGELLANPESQQSVAIQRVSAKRLFVLTGTPIPNYPRDLLPIISAVAGAGSASQPYSARGEFMAPGNINTLAMCIRGIDKFRDDFVTLEWVTNEFAENLTQGAKREVPKIGNLPSYRAWMAPHIKRRLMKEPDVARYITVKDPVLHAPEKVEWDAQHLAYYLTVADEFAAWFKKTREAESGMKGNNLVALLARINAVIEACNYPQKGKMNHPGISGLSSKQRWCINRLVELSSQGHKTIFYCHKPSVVELIARELAKCSIESVRFHGEIPIKARTNALNKGFRQGSAPVLLATKGCTQAGLNIPQADWVVFYDRSWSAKEERQALRRAVRPEQTKEVHAEYCHIEGSIDDYMGQMVQFKADCADAGLDWATPEMDDVAFLHIDTILEQFIDGLAGLHGRKAHEIRNSLKEAA